MIFSGADHALSWAYQISSTPIVKMSSVKPPSPSGTSDMSPHDRHAQAALIIGMIERVLDINQIVWVMAQYGAALRGGDGEKRVANQLVKTMIAMAPTGSHSRRGYEKLIRCYFGQRVNMIEVGRVMRVGESRLYEIRKKVYGDLDTIGARALCILEDEMHRTGLIMDEVEA